MMGLKKVVLAVLLLFLVSNLLTTIWYMISDNANMVSFRREGMNYMGLMLNHFIFALGFVYLFPYYFRQHKSFVRAFVFGVILSSIMFIPTGIVVRSIWLVDFNSIFILNSMAHLIIGGIMGLILAVIFNFRNNGDEENKK